MSFDNTSLNGLTENPSSVSINAELALAAADAEPNNSGLWVGDEGQLPQEVRRVLVSLLRESHLSQRRRREQWATLLAHESAVRSRLHDFFLELIIDREHEIAFVRQVDFEDAPQVVRTQSLTFMDTLVLLSVRQTLLAEEGRGRPFISLDELTEELLIYRGGRDETDFQGRVRASWRKLVNWGLLNETESGRAEISPIVRFLVDSDRITAIRKAYDRLNVDGAQTKLENLSDLEEEDLIETEDGEEFE